MVVRPAYVNRLVRSSCMVVFGVAICLAAAGCGSGRSTSNATSASRVGVFTNGTRTGETPVRGGVLAFARSVQATELDPALSSTNAGGYILPQIFDQLVEQLPGSTLLQAGVASSWSISADGLTYDFQLRHDVRFSNGAQLTASDVVFTLHRLASPVNTNSAAFHFPLRNVTARTPHEVRVILSHPVPAFILDLSDPIASIVPATVVSHESEAQFGQRPVGSGAFVVKSFTPGKSLVLARNPYYWRSGQPYLNSVVFTNTPDANQRILAVQSGQANVADAIPYDQAATLLHASGVKLVVIPLAEVDAGYWNDGKAPFTDIAVRRALNYATPRDALIKHVYQGLATPANSIIPKNAYWDASVPPYRYDPVKAKQLIATSSVPHGFSMTLMIPSGDPGDSTTAQILQAAWAQIGVRVTLRPLDFGTLVTQFFAGNYDMVLFPSGSEENSDPAPDALADLFYNYNDGSHAEGTFWNNPQEIALTQQAATATSETVRRQLYRNLQSISQSLAQELPLVFAPALNLVSGKVRDFTTLPGGSWRLEQVWLAP